MCQFPLGRCSEDSEVCSRQDVQHWVKEYYKALKRKDTSWATYCKEEALFCCSRSALKEGYTQCLKKQFEERRKDGSQRNTKVCGTDDAGVG